MKKILLAAALTALTTTAFAADLKPYIEGSVGYTNFEDNIKITPGTSELEVKSDVNYSIEAGLKDVFFKGLRLSVSDTYMKGVEDKSTGETSYSKSNTNTFLANAYYDFDIGAALVPYVGVGIGGYKMNTAKDAEFAWQLKAGANYNINNNVYIGGRAAFTRLSGATPADAPTYSLEDFNSYSLNAVLGYNF
jgi:opacity protein-like surface antigen